MNTANSHSEFYIFWARFDFGWREGVTCSARGKRLDSEGRCVLVGVARLPPSTYVPKPQIMRFCVMLRCASLQFALT